MILGRPQGLLDVLPLHPLRHPGPPSDVRLRGYWDGRAEPGELAGGDSAILIHFECAEEPDFEPLLPIALFYLAFGLI